MRAKEPKQYIHFDMFQNVSEGAATNRTLEHFFVDTQLFITYILKEDLMCVKTYENSSK